MWMTKSSTWRAWQAAQLTINSTQEPLHDRLLEMTDGRGPDVAIEAIGTAATFRAAVEEVAFTGRVVYIGYAKEPVSYETGYSFKKNWTLSAPEMLYRRISRP